MTTVAENDLTPPRCTEHECFESHASELERLSSAKMMFKNAIDLIFYASEKPLETNTSETVFEWEFVGGGKLQCTKATGEVQLCVNETTCRRGKQTKQFVNGSLLWSYTH